MAVFFDHELLDGARVTKASSYDLRAFTSPNVPLLARQSPTWQWLRTPQSGQGWGEPGSSRPAPYRRCDVPVFSMVPGMGTDRLTSMLRPLPQAVLLRAFGVGNVPTEEPGLITVLERTIAAGVPVVVASQCYQADVDPNRYAAGRELAEVGAVGARDMTVEAAYAKICFLISQGLRGGELARWIGVNIAGELTS